MTDSVAIVPDFAFIEQVQELSHHFSRSLPESSRSGFLSSLQKLAVEAKDDEEKRKGVVSELVRGVGEGLGGMEGGEREVESAHLLLQNLLATTFASQPETFQKSYTTVMEAVEKGVKASNEAGGKAKGEVGLRIITNAYNLLPASSPVRPSTLLTLLTLLSQSKTTDLSALPLPLSTLSALLSTSPLSHSEKSAFLLSVSDIYRDFDAPYAVDVRRLAVLEGEVSKENAEKTLALALGLEGEFGKVAEVWGMNGVKEVVGEDMGKLIGFVVGGGEGKLSEGLDWVESKNSWLEGLAIAPEQISRKLRLLALTRLCAESGSRDISYADVAKGLDVGITEVEGWVVDAIESSLLSARLSQPTQTLHLLSIPTITSTTSFGTREWQLLGQRLQEWKDTVEGVRKVVDEALHIGEAGPEQQGGRRGGRKETVQA